MNFFRNNDLNAENFTNSEEKKDGVVCTSTDVNKSEFVGATRVRRNFVTRKYNWTVDYKDLSELNNGVSTQFPFVVLNDGTRLDVEIRVSYNKDNLTLFPNKGRMMGGFRVKVDKRELGVPVDISGSTIRLYISNPEGIIIWANSYYNVLLSDPLAGCLQTLGPVDWEKEIPEGCTVRLLVDAHYVESDFESLGEVKSSE